MHVQEWDSKDQLTLRLHNALIHENAELTSYYFIPGVHFAREPTHGCMIGVDREYSFSTLITNCGVLLVHDLLKPESIFKIRRLDQAQTNLGFQKGNRLEAFRLNECIGPKCSTVD